MFTTTVEKAPMKAAMETTALATTSQFVVIYNMVVVATSDIVAVADIAVGCNASCCSCCYC